MSSSINAVKAASATSRKPNGQDAVREACEFALKNSSLNRADWALIFASVYYEGEYKRMLCKCKEILKTDRIVGCSALGILTEQGEINDPPVLALLVGSSSEMEIKPFFIPELERGGRFIAEEIIENIPSNCKSVVLFPDIFHFDSDPFFEVLNDYNQKREEPLQIVGGAPSSENPNCGTVQFAGNEVACGAISGFYLCNSFSPRVAVTQACKLITETMEITASEGNWILELDNKPAFAVLREKLPEPIWKDMGILLRSILLSFPADESLPLNEKNFLVRNIAGIDQANEIIACGGSIKSGMKIAFALRNPDSARDHLKEILQNLKEDFQNTTPQFGLYFNCCARGKDLYGFGDNDISYIVKELNSFPLIGLSSFAEIGPIAKKSFLQAYTGVLMVT